MKNKTTMMFYIVGAIILFLAFLTFARYLMVNSVMPFAIALSVGLILLASWVFTLVLQAKRKEYVWFILTVVFPIVMLVYWIFRMVK
jgi:hypothetical protein